MKHICPKCGFEYVGDLDKCPNCGFEVEKAKVEDSESQKEKVTEDSPKRLNDDIQWSEYKEMPIGSVAEILNESLDSPEEANLDNPVEKFADNAESQPGQGGNADLFSKKSNSDKSNEGENGILSQYMKEHQQEEPSADAEEPAEKSEEPETASTTEAQTNTEEKKSTIHKSHEPLNLFVLDTEESHSDETEKETTINSELPKFDDPELEPLPSEDEQVEAKYEQPSVFDQAPQSEVKTQQEAPSTQAASNDTVTRSKPKSSKKWLFLGGVAAVLLIGGGVAFAYHQQQSTAEQATVQKKDNTAKIKALQADLNAFYTDDSHIFIKEEKVNDSLSKLKTELDEYEGDKGYDDLVSTYDDVNQKISLINKVNELYTTPAISNDKLAENLLLKADKAITLNDQSGDDGFAKLINQSLSEAKSQYDTLQTAKSKVAAVFADGKVVDGADRAAYDDAATAVSAVKNQDLVTDLSNELEQVNASLADAEAETAAEAEDAADTTDTTGDTSSYSVGDGGALNGFAMNQAGNPIVNSNAADIADTGNAAWAWEAGIQDTVIQKCIDRSYITADNYTLEPAVIVDGNGFYNLYKTTNGTKSYVVTINCKTGWFKGNGPGGPNTRVG